MSALPVETTDAATSPPADRSARSVVRGLLGLLRRQLEADRVLLVAADGAPRPVLSVGGPDAPAPVGEEPSLRRPVGPDAEHTVVVHGRADADLDDRDRALLRDVGELLAPHLAELRETPPSSSVAALAASLDGAVGLESLTRPLLTVLQELTHLASTYLTVVDEAADEQQILMARNVRPDFAIPEGLRVPWGDTLCKRALDEGRACTTDVPAVWGDSDAARALGIQVYVSVPVELSDGQVWGTLCAADSLAGDRPDEHVATMRLFSRLIAAEIERSAAIARATSDATRALELAITDRLTGCATRHVIEPRISAALADRPDDHAVVVAFVDVNDFKPINDTFGHDAGDRVLAGVAEHLRGQMRPDDLIGRYGGDEFVLAAVVPRDASDAYAARMAAQDTVTLELGGTTRTLGLSIGIAVSGVDDAATPAELIGLADQRMYEHKARTKARSAARLTVA
jgi:diguanylate cyclase